MKFHLLGCLLLAATIPSISGAQTPGPRLIVLNKADATLTVVDPASGKVLGKVAFDKQDGFALEAHLLTKRGHVR